MRTPPSAQLKQLRRRLPLLKEGSLHVDLFTEAHFDAHGVWLLTPEGVFRAFGASGKWSPWEERKASREEVLRSLCRQNQKTHAVR